MGFTKPIEQYLFSDLLIKIQVFMYLKYIIRVLVWLMNTLEMPLANVCGHGDVRVPTRDVVMKCCRKAGLKVEKFEIRKGMRLHCVVRKQ
ncbi:hypothetical protein NE634_11335 [Lacrimispora saccharolytica]|nr:hypothetical protein [Lacrimispora saccharolytica]